MAGLVGNNGETSVGLGPNGLEAGLEGGLDPDPSPLGGERGEVQPPVGLSRASMQNDWGCDWVLMIGVVVVGGDAPDDAELGGEGGGLVPPFSDGVSGGGGVLVVMTALCRQLLDDCSRFTKLVISELRLHQRPITRHYNS